MDALIADPYSLQLTGRSDCRPIQVAQRVCWPSGKCVGGWGVEIYVSGEHLQKICQNMFVDGCAASGYSFDNTSEQFNSQVKKHDSCPISSHLSIVVVQRSSYHFVPMIRCKSQSWQCIHLQHPVSQDIYIYIMHTSQRVSDPPHGDIPMCCESSC